MFTANDLTNYQFNVDLLQYWIPDFEIAMNFQSKEEKSEVVLSLEEDDYSEYELYKNFRSTIGYRKKLLDSIFQPLQKKVWLELLNDMESFAKIPNIKGSDVFETMFLELNENSKFIANFKTYKKLVANSEKIATIDQLLNSLRYWNLNALENVPDNYVLLADCSDSFKLSFNVGSNFKISEDEDLRKFKVEFEVTYRYKFNKKKQNFIIFKL